ncbi:MAG: hypothetical protein FIB01_13500 [Gemmatimonadetes bacterium]|nr:hypothetical protein [Gemmatimonadota bacterium]
MKIALGILASLFAVGCISTKVQRLDLVPRPVRSPAAVAVLYDRPTQPYTIIAVVRSGSPAVFDSYDDLRRELVTRAAVLGGDAVIIGRKSTKTTLIPNTVGFVLSESRSLAAEVIVYD